MPPKKKRSAGRSRSATSGSPPPASQQATAGGERDESVPRNGSNSSSVRAPQHCAETALLFWLQAATEHTTLCVSESFAAPRISTDSENAEQAVSCVADDMSGGVAAAEAAAAQAAESAAPTGTAPAVNDSADDDETTQNPQQDPQQTATPSATTAAPPQPPATNEQKTTTEAPSTSSRPPPSLQVHDVMPLFGAMLAGQLGPVVLDVQLQGQTRLLEHPQLFEATLHGYGKESAAPLREALRHVQPFFLFCSHAVAGGGGGGGGGGESSEGATGSENNAPSQQQQRPQESTGQETKVATNARENNNSSSNNAAAATSLASTSPKTVAAALYTLDPSNHYPVLPLLAQLLQAPTVTKLVLHSQLLYRLLFLFLGTDRVDIQRVVDLTTWSELGRQLRPTLVATYPIPIDGVVELAEVQSALPTEVRQWLISETAAMAQSRPLLAYESTHEPARGEGFNERSALACVDTLRSADRSSEEENSICSGSSSSISDEEYRDNKKGDGDVGAADAGLTSTDGTFPENEDGDARCSCDSISDSRTAVAQEEQDAVELLHGIVPVNQQPLSSAADRRDKRDGSGKRFQQHVVHPRRHITKRQREESLRPTHDAFSSSSLAAPSSAEIAALASIYGGLKSLTLFFTEVLTKFFDNVTGVTRPLPTTATTTTTITNTAGREAGTVRDILPYRLSPSEWCAQRTYAAFLCEMMHFHGLFVHDAVFYGMQTVLDVQLQTIEDLGERVMATLLERIDKSKSNRSPGESRLSGEGLGMDAMSLTAENVRRCLDAGPAAPLLAAHPRLDADLLRALASAAGTAEHEQQQQQQQTQVTADVAAQLRFSCQLLCIWMAHSDRTDAKRKVTDMFGKVADRLQARVVERPLDVHTTNRTSHSSRTPTATTAPPCELCFSVHPTWTLHNASTGRIFSLLPNVQNLSKQPPHTTFAVHALRATPPPAAASPSSHASPRLYGAVDVPTPSDVTRWVELTRAATTASAASPSLPPPLLFPEQPHWTMRHLYRAPPGCVLVSFDFNQLELRVLAQLSGDATLQQHLSAEVDVLTLTTARVLQLPSADRVKPHQRQAVKVIVYGLLYGMGPKAMEERISKIRREADCSDDDGDAEGNDARENGEDGALHAGKTTSETNATITTSVVAGTTSPVGGSPRVSNAPQSATHRAVPLTALQLISRFHHVYPRVESYLRETRQTGLRSAVVETLSGCKSLAAVTDNNRRKQRAVAQAIQGGAADVVLCGMRAVHGQRHTLLPYLPAAPFALVMTIHDELVYAVPRGAVAEVARAVKATLEAQARVLRFAVPLPVSVRVGPNFGALEPYFPE